MNDKLRTRHRFDTETLAFLGGLCLFLSIIEYMIPKPVPFFRLGLANIPILLALPVMDFRSLLVLMLLKVTGQALMNGTLASYVFLFSAAGTLISGLSMWMVHRLGGRHISFVGISIVGAVSSNVIQVFLSLAFIFGTSAWLIAPLFMGLGLASGVATGLFALYFARTSGWYSLFLAHYGVMPPVTAGKNGDPKDTKDGAADNVVCPGEKENRAPPKKRRRFRANPDWDILGRSMGAGFIFWWGLVLVFLFLFQTSLSWRIVQVILLIILAISAGKRLQPAYFVIMVLTISFFNLLVPSGPVLLDLGFFQLTQGALVDGLFKGLGIAGLVFVSLGTVRRNLRLPGKSGRLVGRMFWYNELLLSRRSGLVFPGIVKSLDKVLHDLDAAAKTSAVGREESGDPASSLPLWVGVITILVVSSCFVLPFIF